MEALAFIAGFGSYAAARAIELKWLWKLLHPSEDGEALQKSSVSILDSALPHVPMSMADSAMMPGWFAIYITCRHEKRVSEHLDCRGIEHYLPLYKADRKWRDGSRVTLNLPLFPCYLFVRIPLCERRRVLEVPSVLTLLTGIGEGAAPLEGALIESLRVGAAEGRVEPHPLLTVGQRTRVRAGVFSGMEGIVTRRKNALRVVLTLELIMQSIAVEIDETDLEAIEGSTRSASRYVA